ncbi:N-acetylmuramoyl-L-alanine amidase [Pedobacter hartonius]|uniref:N-acetylmuramoyl-L-alanine amidase n=2 Tax=Pedobacter hartonius TaxID=425514 RepID=A0A1H3W623_9SPHI|nr:N-acetylmuramoyl-L-alanine amidase [Pedobacter hartonius]
MKILIYLAEAALSTVVFFAFYALFLKKLTFFRINRFYLLSALLFSFIIPALQITIHRTAEQVQAGNTLPGQIEKLHIRSSRPMVNRHEYPVSIPALLVCGYICIAFLSLGMGLFRLYRLLKYIRTDSIEKDGLKIIHKTNGFVNCSFFNYVFIDPRNLTGAEMQILLHHEQVHAKQWHSADKLFLLLCRSLLWFNPVVYLYDRELGKVQEFEADAATSNLSDVKTYASLLIKLSHEKTSVFTHSFGTHPVKERITMLFNASSATYSRWAYILIVPLLCGLIWLFSFQYVYAAPLSGPPFTLVLDAGHGGTDKGSEFQDIAEKQLALALTNKVKVMAEARGITVVNTRNKDVNVSLKDRAQKNGDLLISLHCNTAADQHQNGIQIMSSRPSSDRLKSARLGMLSDKLFQKLKDLEGIRTDQLSKDVTGLYLLEKSLAPSVLLELGFISNSADRAFLTDPARQDDLAAAIVQSVLDYRTDLIPLRK